MEKDPKRRYADAAALCHDLDRYTRSGWVSARGVGPLGRVVRRAERHPVPWAIGTLLAVIAMASLAWAARDRFLAERDARQAERFARPFDRDRVAAPPSRNAASAFDRRRAYPPRCGARPAGRRRGRGAATGAGGGRARFGARRLGSGAPGTRRQPPGGRAGSRFRRPGRFPGARPGDPRAGAARARGARPPRRSRGAGSRAGTLAERSPGAGVAAARGGHERRWRGRWCAYHGPRPRGPLARSRRGGRAAGRGRPGRSAVDDRGRCHPGRRCPPGGIGRAQRGPHDESARGARAGRCGAPRRARAGTERARASRAPVLLPSDAGDGRSRGPSSSGGLGSELRPCRGGLQGLRRRSCPRRACRQRGWSRSAGVVPSSA